MTEKLVSSELAACAGRKGWGRVLVSDWCGSFARR